MNVRVFGISDNSTLIPLPETVLSASCELEKLLTPFHLRPEVLAACLTPERSEHMMSQKNALYMEVPTHLGWDQSEKPYVSFLCLKSTVITIHRDKLHTIEDVIRNLDGDVPLYANNSSALLYFLLVEIGKQTVNVALRVREEAEQLDQACHENPDALDPQKFSILHRKISHYAAV
ncbi:CorA-like Mg2+ transporter protein [Gimesia alba]|uniref:CorA-like Mg2+ transporter protein n=1 Tax=Gimesia alba TaxID=2527973 RepID=A0A517RP97_9PLAN|nr:CorA family divalent cation transporter [Gimesia alba]QDT45689.1 CorA-like Mg2+ transporter protein [Gimesia alba]